MTKTNYHTYDYFTYKNAKQNKRCFDYCHKVALECGLACMCKIGDQHHPKLYLWGTKYQFLKYYFRTLTKNHGVVGVKRLLAVAFWN